MSLSDSPDWRSIMDDWAYAYGRPQANGNIKTLPEDFKVSECMDIEPDGSGEHVWLHITKIRQNSEQVSKALARHANVAYRDVGYSGLKDFFAVTDQWFSVWLANQDDPDWQTFELSGVTINKVVRHSRKIRRGTHRANQFTIVIKDFVGDVGEFEQKLEMIRRKGVPNYFGEQRFGREASNMLQVYDAFVSGRSIKNRNLRSLLYSSARSWIFNCIVARRIEEGTWNSLYEAEPANLNGSGSVFTSAGDALTADRLAALDIHPTAPLVGKIKEKNQPQTSDALLPWFELEQAVCDDYPELVAGLQQAGLSYQRRPTRIAIRNLTWSHTISPEGSVQLSFELQRGQYATSVLRELISADKLNS